MVHQILLLFQVLKKIGKYFKLCKHGVKDVSENKDKKIKLPALVTIIKAGDGTYHISDWTKLTATNDPNNPYLNFFRLEFLQLFVSRISADAFTVFGEVDKGVHDPNAIMVINQLKNFMNFELWKRIIIQNLPFVQENIATLLHRYGINLRYLGILRCTIRDLYNNHVKKEKEKEKQKEKEIKEKEAKELKEKEAKENKDKPIENKDKPIENKDKPIENKDNVPNENKDNVPNENKDKEENDDDFDVDDMFPEKDDMDPEKDPESLLFKKDKEGKEKDQFNFTEDLYKKFDLLLLKELILRCIKSYFDFKLRKATANLPLEEEYRKVLVETIKTEILEDNNEFWKKELKRMIKFKFTEFALNQDELKEDYNLKIIFEKENLITLLNAYTRASNITESDARIRMESKGILKLNLAEKEFLNHYIKYSNNPQKLNSETDFSKLKHFENWTSVMYYMKYNCKVIDDPEKMKALLDTFEGIKYKFHENLIRDDYYIGFVLKDVKEKFPTIISNDIVKVLSTFTNITELDLHSCSSITDDALANISKLRNLTLINISNTNLTNEGLKRLTYLTDLQQIDIRNNTKITEEGLQHINFCPNIIKS